MDAVKVKFECQDGDPFKANVTTEDGSPIRGVKSFAYRLAVGEVSTGLIELHAVGAEITDRWVPEAEMLMWKERAERRG
jgi:hypothetical protein